MIKVSIIIPTYNRLRKLKRVIHGLENQRGNLDQFEVIVVSDGSTDGTEAYLRAIQTPLQIQVLLQPNQGVAAARNNGSYKARAEIILFVDDDVIPGPDLVAEHIKFHETYGSRVVVLGPMLTPSGYEMSPWVYWEQIMLEKQYEAMRSGRNKATCRQFFTGNSSLARCHLMDVGGFDPSFRRAEDVELAYRLSEIGLEFIYNPEAIGYHYAERSYAAWSSIPYAYGKNDVIFSLHKRQDWLLPTVYSEFHNRHQFTRLLTRVCLDRPRLSSAVIGTLKWSSILFHRLGIHKLSISACSGIFNLRYYQGVADQLGSRETLLKGIVNSVRNQPESAVAVHRSLNDDKTI